MPLMVVAVVYLVIWSVERTQTKSYIIQSRGTLSCSRCLHIHLEYIVTLVFSIYEA